MESHTVSNSSPPAVHNIETYTSSLSLGENANYGIILALASGVVMHITVFRIGEWDVAAPSIVAGYALAFLATTLLSTFQLATSLTEVAQTASYHFIGLFASMLIYRAFFHKLSNYPGPFLARLTTFYITARSVRKLHLYEEVRSLHGQYGDIVRLGECEQMNSERGD